MCCRLGNRAVTGFVQTLEFWLKVSKMACLGILEVFDMPYILENVHQSSDKPKMSIFCKAAT